MFDADITCMQHIPIYIILFVASALSYYLRKLTMPGAIAGFITAVFIFIGAGYTGLAMLATFFITGAWATGWRKTKKVIMNSGERHHNQRTAGQVLANGGLAALLGCIDWLIPQQQHWVLLMMAGSFAAAMADTLSSELGTIYGTRFYNIITLKKDIRGLDGVVSLEGTLIGLAGAALIAIIYISGIGWSINFMYIIIAGLIGNIVDSVSGATLERKGIIGNNMVNLLNTLTGALICLVLSKIH